MTRGQNANKAKPVPAGNLMEKPHSVSSVSSCAFCVGVGAPQMASGPPCISYGWTNRLLEGILQ